VSKKVRGKTHRALRKPPASGRKPCCRKVTGRDIEAVADELVTYHRWFHAMFQRREQRQWSLFYLCGQLSNLKRKTIEPMILELHGAIPEAVRALARPAGVSQGKWEVHSLVVQLQALVAEWLGDPDGVVIADGSGFPTARPEGAHSAAVARQYCGQLGKIANCQEGVFLAEGASRHGYTFLDERLYVPGECRRWRRVSRLGRGGKPVAFPAARRPLPREAEPDPAEGGDGTRPGPSSYRSLRMGDL